MTHTQRFLASLSFLILWTSCVVFSSTQARADYQQRISLGAGIVELRNPSETEFELGIEYEYRLDPLLGMGAFGNYIFSTPGITYLGAPEVFFHPLASEFLLLASPIVEFGQSVGTHFGLRLGTRVPLPLGALTLVPSFAIDLISGGPDYIIGLGFEF